jgi:polysaccharide biosynthesis protein VpsJ
MISGENYYKSKFICDEIYRRACDDDFMGYDPFDGLNSSLFRRLEVAKNKVVRIGWVQLNKRSFINFRPLIGVDKARNPKGVALFISGLLERFESRNSNDDLDQAIKLGDWLLGERVDREVWGYGAWGYHFDWAARAFYVPKGKPNAITTCYVAKALYQLWQKTSLDRFRDAAIEAGFFLDSLYTDEAATRFYAYIPGERAFVHNASLWSAAVVIKAAVDLKNQPMIDRAVSVIKQSLDAQKSDGSWNYGALSHHEFIDGFHTGYNLEALSAAQSSLGVEIFKSHIEKGLAFYKDNFFTPEGDVKYYSDNVWPLDTHSVAQAIVTLIRVGRAADDFQLVEKILSRAFDTLYMPKEKRFVYQRSR